ncbi:MAG: preprotein translocase subunit YajC [Planctomycetaceae bacterium]
MSGWLHVIFNALYCSAFSLVLFAQGDGAGAADAGGAAGAPQVSPLLQLLPYFTMAMLMYFFMVLRPQQREQADRQKKLDSLKRNDKVLTIGGLIGTIVDFSPDGSRVTLKFGDSTRIPFTRSSIQGLYEEKTDPETTDK